MSVVEKKHEVTHDIVDVYTYTWSMRNYKIIAKYGPACYSSRSKSPKFILNSEEYEIGLYNTRGLSVKSPAVELRVDRIRVVPADSEGITAESIKARIRFASISILNDSNEKFKTSFLTFQDKEDNETSWVFNNFVEKKELEDKSNRLLENDTLNILFELTHIRTSKNSINGNSRIENVFQSDYLQLHEKRQNYMENMFLSTRYSDVKLVTEDGRELSAHKIILSSLPFFNNMLQHEMKENMTSVIVMKDIEHEVLKEMLRFIYTGKVKNIAQVASKLFIAADKYLMDDLKTECSNYLYNKMSTKNVLDIWELADKHNVEELKIRAVKFVKENFDDIIQSTDVNFMAWLKNLADQMPLQLQQ